MLTNTTKKTAETIRDELLPICETLQKLAKKVSKTTKEHSQAHRVAVACQYPQQKYYADEAGENSQEIQETRNNNAEKWHEILENKYKIESEKETADKLARLNYHNYLLYFCDMLAHLLRSGNAWAQFYEKKGIESLGEYLREELKERCYISRDGGGFDPFGAPNFYCYFNITIYGACCISGNNWGTYRQYKEDEGTAEKPSAPQIYTMAQYVKIVKNLNKLESEAQAKAREHYDTARKTGLIYFIGGLDTPYKKAWKMRD